MSGNKGRGNVVDIIHDTSMAVSDTRSSLNVVNQHVINMGGRFYKRYNDSSRSLQGETTQRPLKMINPVS
jgi:hypothetical protein